MTRYPLAVVAVLACCLAAARGQTGKAKPTSAQSQAGGKTSILGLSLAPVPELLYDHVRPLQKRRGQGVVIQQVAADSAAADSGLERNDILLSYNGTPVRNGDHLLQMLRGVTADQKARVSLIRGGQEMRVSVRFAAPLALSSPTGQAFKAVVKSSAPPAVSLKAEPLEDGKLQVTFVYYSDGKGKLDRVTCCGSLPQIRDQVRNLGAKNQIPVRVQELVEVALKRIGTLNAP